jgi:formylglycine-generating enzyme required for sulfatase activity
MVESYKIEGVEFKLVQLPERGFSIGQTQVTQELWEAVMGSNPSNSKGAKHPVECVSWEDSVEFANALSLKLGLTPAFEGSDNDAHLVEGADGFRLPFEAEWEFAAKGGQSFEYAGSDNLSEVGWFRDNSNQQTHDVANLKPNGYGVYDMSGNVWEWCLDDYENPGQYRPGAARRSLRGGSWYSGAQGCTVAVRDRDSPDDRYYLGLRLVRSLG